MNSISWSYATFAWLHVLLEGLPDFEWVIGQEVPRLTELSDLLQDFYHLVRIAQRVHCRVGEKLSANHGKREAAQVNSPVGKLLSQLRGDARPILARDFARNGGYEQR